MAGTWKPRNPSPLRLSQPQLEHRHILYPGSSDDDSPELAGQKRKRREALGAEYLRGRFPLLLTASLRGPLPDDSNDFSRRGRAIEQRAIDHYNKRVYGIAERRARSGRLVNSVESVKSQGFRMPAKKGKKARQRIPPPPALTSDDAASSSQSPSLPPLPSQHIGPLYAQNGKPIQSDSHESVDFKPITESKKAGKHGTSVVQKGKLPQTKGLTAPTPADYLKQIAYEGAQNKDLYPNGLPPIAATEAFLMSKEAQEGAKALCGGVESLMAAVNSLMPDLNLLAENNTKSVELLKQSTLKRSKNGGGGPNHDDMFAIDAEFWKKPAENLAAMQEKIKLLRETCEKFTNQEWKSFMDNREKNGQPPLESLPDFPYDPALPTPKLEEPILPAPVDQLPPVPLSSAEQARLANDRKSSLYRSRRAITEENAERLVAQLARRTSQMAHADFEEHDSGPDHLIHVGHEQFSASQPSLRDLPIRPSRPSLSQGPPPEPGLALQDLERIMAAVERSKELGRLDFSESGEAILDGPKGVSKTMTNAASLNACSEAQQQTGAKFRSEKSINLLETDKQSPSLPSGSKSEADLPALSTQAAIAQAQRSLQADLVTPQAKPLPRPTKHSHPLSPSSSDSHHEPAIAPFHAIRSQEKHPHPQPSTQSHQQPLSTQALIENLSPFDLSTIKSRPGQARHPRTSLTPSKLPALDNNRISKHSAPNTAHRPNRDTGALNPEAFSESLELLANRVASLDDKIHSLPSSKKLPGPRHSRQAAAKGTVGDGHAADADDGDDDLANDVFSEHLGRLAERVASLEGYLLPEAQAKWSEWSSSLPPLTSSGGGTSRAARGKSGPSTNGKQRAEPSRDGRRTASQKGSGAVRRETTQVPSSPPSATSGERLPPMRELPVQPRDTARHIGSSAIGKDDIARAAQTTSQMLDNVLEKAGSFLGDWDVEREVGKVRSSVGEGEASSGAVGSSAVVGGAGGKKGRRRKG